MMTRLSFCSSHVLLLSLVTVTLVHGLAYDPTLTDYNLNTNQEATNPLEYSGTPRGDNFTYFPSPESWRFPYYTIFLDRFVNGDPTNDNSNGTVWEMDPQATQLRHGGDLQGLIDTLDYIAGMGVKAVYIAGSPFINQPWGADQYSPLDMTLLDFHPGTIATWQNAIDQIHSRGMWVILDNTMATLGDLIGWEGYLNTSAPFSYDEYHTVWKTERQYHDFHVGSDYNATCDYPQFWYENGSTIETGLVGCYNSDFDQYGDIEAFGVFPDWQRELSKFASVQDRLREWIPDVRARLEVFSCMTIATLDIDGFRIDKGVQVTVDAQASFSSAMRQCASQYQKNNFMVIGEITSGNALGAIYVGRGRTPTMAAGLWPNSTAAMTLSNSTSDDQYFVRESGNSALDAAAFHYSVYRYMARFLGMSGNFTADYDFTEDWVLMWNEMVASNDFYNANNGMFDPRHLYGVSNQDVFRWSSITQGTERMLLGYFITTLTMPGSPLIYYGEEQDLYVLDGTAQNYVYGRQAFSPSVAWKAHGCYTLGSNIYASWPVERGATGCSDPGVIRDHRDPSGPIRNIFKRMFALRELFPVLQDGFELLQLSSSITNITLPGSGEPTQFGIWSIARAFSEAQNQTGTPVWLVFHNVNETTTYTFDCNDAAHAFFAPFDENTSVRDLLSTAPAIQLGTSSTTSSFSNNPAGCLSSITMEPYAYRAYVPAELWVPPSPMVTYLTPGHDTSIDTTGWPASGSFPVTIYFSTQMDCDSVSSSVTALLYSSAASNGTVLSFGQANCSTITADPSPQNYTGYIPSVWGWTASLQGIQDGVVQITISNASTSANGSSTNASYTNAVDHTFLRFGKQNNPIVFPESANYSRTLLVELDGDLFVNHSAAGASLYRYSTNFASSWSSWITYPGDGIDKTKGFATLPWNGTALQAWTGTHLTVQYWSQPLGSASFLQHSDVWTATTENQYARQIPHIFLQGYYNQWGYDAGLPGSMNLVNDNNWTLHFMYEWPTGVQFNVWGINPDNQPDETFTYGDIDGDGIADRLPPSSLSDNVYNITSPPPMPYLSWLLLYNDASWQIMVVPQGHIAVQIALFILLPIIPILTGAAAVYIYMRSFYQVKVNKSGFTKKRFPQLKIENLPKLTFGKGNSKGGVEMRAITPTGPTGGPLGGTSLDGERKTVLIATMEYNIDDLKIKIKIGGLGVMAQLMGTALGHINLVWVVPMVGDIDYPTERFEVAESIFVQVMGQPYEIQVYYYSVKNIVYVLLDAPIFRKQTQKDPYIARMDDIESAILYAAWNYSIAETIRRFPIDIYHINDYHGAAAPLYLLPQTIPCCLSLHNAEFQGMWPMRTPEEQKEVCEVFNLPPDVVKDYVQYGSVFNLLHAGASYLRIHQRGFGAVGVSRKYGDRSLARYPIFWSLKNIGHLPNPDPSDTADWDPSKDVNTNTRDPKGVDIDKNFEENRGNLRRQAQEWAGLEVDPDAELFVFVGRWSLQKGVDLIADIFPSILEKYPTTQLICIGPVIDLYGRFAALKLEKLMQKYPKRVFSKPEFTQLPPYIFSGAEFALIPSRDEPFGLVAVEFGRKGALGVGARVGGLGQMPGFWYTIESMSPSHLLQQFRQAITSALECKYEKRALMRAWSAKQRFPVAQWISQLDELYAQSIRIHKKEASKKKGEIANGFGLSITRPPSRASTVTYVDQSSNLANPVALDPASVASPMSPARVASPLLGHGLSPGLPAPNAPWAGGMSNSPRGSIAGSIASSVDGRDARDTRDAAQRGSVWSVDSFAVRAQRDGPSSPGLASPAGFGGLPVPQAPGVTMHRNSSLLSLPDVVGDRHDLKLQQVDQFFNDNNGEFYAQYEEMLDGLTAKNSASEMCIEMFIKKSEKEWFGRYRDAKLGVARGDAGRSHHGSPHGSRSPSRADSGSRNASIVSRGRQRSRTPSGLARSEFESWDDQPNDPDDEFLLGDSYKAPTGLKKFLSIRVGDWPAYSFLLAFQQVVSVNSYQIVLITGSTNQTPMKLYLVAATYIITSILWWILIRNFKAVYSLSIPWIFYGFAFLLLGVAPFSGGSTPEEILQIMSTCLYAAGASSGALAFALNFGDEGGSPTRQWITRALIVSGFQQVYSLALWYWGSLVTMGQGTVSGVIANTIIPEAVVICIPIAIFLWAIAVVLFLGLPDYYRQSPVTIPGFYISLWRRKLVPWFFVTIVIQNYWLSTQYGRSWQFLFASQFIPGWGVFVLALGFALGLWGLVLYGFSVLADEHTWLLPIFAVGLGAPRWAHEFWATSGIGWYLPWVGSAVGSAILTRCLWLWLVLLDTVQGVGQGMMLLATLTRQHVLAVLIGAQIVGSAFTMIARATSPNALSPNTTFPDFSQGIYPGIESEWFWVCLLFQAVIPIGFFQFFRKEQVAKP